MQDAHTDCQPIFQQIKEITESNQLKVLQAFQKSKIADFHLNGSTGYGYGDEGRDKLEEVYATLFKAEKALVRAQIVSGTHALALGLLGNLKRGDELISATGRPYDTLLKVIGLHNEKGSLLEKGVQYQEIPLNKKQEIDSETLCRQITNHTKMVIFQRSKGYEWRPSFNLQQMGETIQEVKKHFPQIICMVDNCYGEFVEEQEPLEVGADLVAGSLIKNPGGGLALSGGYLAGKEELVNQAALRLTAPGIDLAVGASLNFNRPAFQGLFLAPLIVGEALQGAVLAANFFARCGFPVLPRFDQPRTDIIQAICLGSRALMLAFCQGLQKACPLEAYVRPEPARLPGYADEVIMAGGTFIQGSSIELSADGPLRPPYNIYLQGGLSLGHIKAGILLAATEVNQVKTDVPNQ